MRNDLVIFLSMQNQICLFLGKHLLQTTVYSFKEVVRYLLENGVAYVLSERFCQDDLENYFGRQRAIGRRRNNPSVRPIQGNVQASVGKFNVIDDTPLPKRRK